MRGALALCLVLAAFPAPLPGQSVLERTPNLHGTWTLPGGTAAFVFAHRFELLNGGDELINVPTLTLGAGLPFGFTAGLDYTSNSEVVPSRLGGNETEYWLKRGARVGGGGSIAGIVAYNTLASSVDGAVSGRVGRGRLDLLGELRAYRRLFGTEVSAVGGTVGLNARLTPYLALSGDLGRVFGQDSVGAVWSGGLALVVPGSPHTLSLHATNGGSSTLQGAVRDKVIGPEAVRYGFAFTVPLGTGSQWARIFRPGAATHHPSPAPGVVRVEMRGVAFAPGEVRIRAGQSVEWVNLDPVAHTATSDQGLWDSGTLAEGDRFMHRFDRPGRFPYHCTPHPQMTGVVIVDPA